MTGYSQDPNYFLYLAIHIVPMQTQSQPNTVFCTDCPENTYGPGCKRLCRCQNGAACDHVSGACTCTAGWRDMFCDKPCPQGFYGIECQGICGCDNGARCDPVTGDCKCTAGWIGTGEFSSLSSSYNGIVSSVNRRMFFLVSSLF